MTTLIHSKNNLTFCLYFFLFFSLHPIRTISAFILKISFKVFFLKFVNFYQIYLEFFIYSANPTNTKIPTNPTSLTNPTNPTNSPSPKIPTNPTNPTNPSSSNPTNSSKTTNPANPFHSCINQNLIIILLFSILLIHLINFKTETFYPSSMQSIQVNLFRQVHTNPKFFLIPCYNTSKSI